MKKIPLILILVFCCLLLAQNKASTPSPDQAGAWEAIGPYGGWVYGIAKSQKNSNELYAVINSYPGQIYQSISAGATWKRIALINSYLYDIAIDPNNPKTIYALGGNSIYKSIDKGKTFKECKYPDYNCYTSSGRISINPKKSNTIFLSGYYAYSANPWKSCLAVYRSTNGGETWTVKKFDAVSYGATMASVVISPANPKIVYACGYYYDNSYNYYYRVYKSTNSGDSWKNITGSIKDLPYVILPHPKDPNRVYVGCGNEVYRSSNGGQTWIKQNDPYFIYAYTLAFDSTNPSILYAGSASSIYKSTDGGINWTQYNNGIYGSCNGLVAIGNKIYFASTAGIFKSTDAGVTWKPGYSGIKASDVPAFAIAPFSPNNLYAEIAQYACFKTTNGGKSWAKLRDFAGCGSVHGVAVHPTNPNTVFFLKGG
jgi:photosystem II stability/assembly factor-like uncharacterized protein